MNGTAKGPAATVDVNVLARPGWPDPKEVAKYVTRPVVNGPRWAGSLDATPGDTKVDLSWTEATGGGAVSKYQYRQRTATAKSAYGKWTDVGLTTTASVTGLTNGTEYRFQVQAVNAAGVAYSDVVAATPSTKPSQVKALTAKAGNAQVTLTWEAPTYGTPASTNGYEHRHRETGGTWEDWTEVTATTATIASLTNNTPYEFEVRAKNSIGAGPAIGVTARPGTPGIPTLTGERAGDGTSAVLSWTPDSSKGTPSTYRTRFRTRAATGGWGDGAALLTPRAPRPPRPSASLTRPCPMTSRCGGRTPRARGRSSRPP